MSPAVARISRNTNRVSAARTKGITTRPSASGGAVGRSNNGNARARIDVVADFGTESPVVRPILQGWPSRIEVADGR